MNLNQFEINQFSRLFHETEEILKNGDAKESHDQLRHVIERCLVGMTTLMTPAKKK